MSDGGLAAIEPTAEGYVEPVVDLGACRGEAPVADGDGATGAHEPLTATEAWAAFGQYLQWYLLMPARDDVTEALAVLDTRIESGLRPSAEEIGAARAALGHARHLVEDVYAPVAPGVDPWDDGVGGRVPYRALREQLEAAGYTVTREPNGSGPVSPSG